MALRPAFKKASGVANTLNSRCAPLQRRRIAPAGVGAGWQQGAGGGGPQRDALAALISGIIAGEQRSAATAIAARSAAAAAGPPHPPHRIPPAERASYPQPPPCAFLRPGQTFEGRQRVSHSHHGSTVKQEHWEVQATIQVGTRKVSQNCIGQDYGGRRAAELGSTG